MTAKKEEKKMITNYDKMKEVLEVFADDNNPRTATKELARFILESANNDIDSDRVTAMMFIAEKLFTACPGLLSEMNMRIIQKVILPMMMREIANEEDKDDIEIPPDAKTH